MTDVAGTTPSAADCRESAALTSRMLEVRRFVLDALRQELVGPSPGLPALQTGLGDASFVREEILRPQDSPRLRFGAGILFAQRSTVTTQDAISAPAEDEIEAARETAAALIVDSPATADGTPTVRAVGARSEADTEQEVNRANEYLPSAMGLTSLIRVPSGGLRIRVRAARYVKREMPGRGRTDDNGHYHPYNAWWRVPIQSDLVVSSDLLVGHGPFAREWPVPTGTPDLTAAVHVFSRPLERPAGVSNPAQPAEGADDGLRMVTVTLLNRTRTEGQRPRDEECLFQCRFAAESVDDAPCFERYPERDTGFDGPEEASLRLLYSHQDVFAVGHGCAPAWQGASVGDLGSEWDEGQARPSHVVNASVTNRVWTEPVPAYEIKPILPEELAGVELSMQLLADADDDRGLELCGQLATQYEGWIRGLRGRVESGEVQEDLIPAARDHISRCEACLARIQQGIALLRSNRRVRRAFGLMNRAMLMQQVHYRLASESPRKWVRDGRRLRLERAYTAPNYTASGSKWRPFQLAFILMNLKSLAEPASEERMLVDVIWFPTGGGKTEAYLGLTAFALFFRRLRNPANAGTTALMRYTLRLLTAQQYQRAASLICACEQLRRADPDSLGEHPMTIGLWVGSQVTPNNEREAVTEIRRLLREGTRNPFVVLTCPWCGAQMGPVKNGGAFETPGYRLLNNPQRVRLICADSACSFSDDRGLPLLVIDEHMYREPPSLLIGTVDKFALLPWYPESAAFFGLNSAGTVSPPDLVIQDELHLISGPLGSMVGHYETIIDALCRSADGVSAKIVASTATISRAAEQVHALYAREAVLFPPQGLRAGDSFFAREYTDRPGRMYVGVFPSGLPSQQTAMVRVMSALLQAPASCAVSDHCAIDPYWTLVAYFNSIRELGSAATLVSADIREYLGVTYERLGFTPQWGDEAAARRRFLSPRGSLELTGRVSGHAVTEALQQLFLRFEARPASARAPRSASSGDAERHDPPVDVCLATNMIQVGLDVPRLGLMLVAGQPKTTSEYIQATSRVGRNTPGLVVTVYSPSKPRDRSHYEHFRAYHQSIYRFVEPTSVTPFAVPVRERALHALLVALVRFWGGDLLRDRPGMGPGVALEHRIRETLLIRARDVDPDEHDETAAMIDRILAEWRRLPPARYGDFAPPDQPVPLMYPSGSQPLPAWQDRARPTPSSLRNVDAECDATVLTIFPRD